MEGEPTLDEAALQARVARLRLAVGAKVRMLPRELSARAMGEVWDAVTRAVLHGELVALPATPFVSIYERGRLVGCVGHDDLGSALRVARSDPRFGGFRGDPADATVQVSILHRARPVPRARLARTLEVGTHGLVATKEDGNEVVLLPDVAADSQLGPQGMLDALVRKAGARSIDALSAIRLVTSERLVFRTMPPAVGVSTIARNAARWLAARVADDGAIDFGVDARSGRVHRTGPFHLGRSAVVLAALKTQRGHRDEVQRAQRALEVSIEAGLAGEGDGMPRDPAEQAGTLALARLAGVVGLDARLVALARTHAARIAEVPWFAAEVVAAIGGRAPEVVRAAALAPITRGEWAPWSVLAADALGERSLARSGRARVAGAIPARGPHAGGVRPKDVPEVALTALAVEVLARTGDHEAAVTRAVAFLERMAYTSPDATPAPLDPRLAFGAFPLAPHADFLRADVTAHALLALEAAAARRRHHR